jgi:LysM repeat protein
MRHRLAFLLAGALLVAACGGGATPAPAASPSATPAPTDIFSQTPLPSEEPSFAPEPSTEASAAPGTPADGTTYTVKANDTMWALSIKFGVTLAALKAANPTVDPATMRIGSVLIIPPQP